jgi:hypothetical protein
MTPPSPPVDFLLEKNRKRAAADFKILEELKSKSDARISAGVGKIDANNWFLSMTWGKGTDHLPIKRLRTLPRLYRGRCRHGRQVADVVGVVEQPHTVFPVEPLRHAQGNLAVKDDDRAVTL